ncbi:MAG: hypothetical protein K9J09_02455 [Limnohabitans sp.]|nr:hypothetical protein [Limnohabitans sp.]
MAEEKKFPRPFRGYEEDGRDYRHSLSNRDEWWGDAQEIKDVMEHFCWLVKYQEPIPRDIQVFIATAFWKYIEKNQNLETAFRLKEEKTGRKKLPPPDGGYIPEHVIDYWVGIIYEGLTLDKSKLVYSNKHKIGKTTLADHVKHYGVNAVFRTVEMFEIDFKIPLPQEKLKIIKYIYPEFEYPKEGYLPFLHTTEN